LERKKKNDPEKKKKREVEPFGAIQSLTVLGGEGRKKEIKKETYKIRDGSLGKKKTHALGKEKKGLSA